jgi:hypothetical protein
MAAEAKTQCLSQIAIAKRLRCRIMTRFAEEICPRCSRALAQGA